MRIENAVYRVAVRRRRSWLETISAALVEQLPPHTYPWRLGVVDIIDDHLVIEATVVCYDPEDKYADALREIELLNPRRKAFESWSFGVVQIVPTGIRREFGGFAGDAGPATNLLAAAADFLLTHPNAVNASELNEMSANVFYVEGKSLDCFLLGHLALAQFETAFGGNATLFMYVVAGATTWLGWTIPLLLIQAYLEIERSRCQEHRVPATPFHQTEAVSR